MQCSGDDALPGKPAMAASPAHQGIPGSVTDKGQALTCDSPAASNAQHPVQHALKAPADGLSQEPDVKVCSRQLSTAPAVNAQDAQGRPPKPPNPLSVELPDQHAGPGHTQQRQSASQDPFTTTAAAGDQHQQQDADFVSQLGNGPLESKPGLPAATTSPEVQVDDPQAQSPPSFARASNPDSMASQTSDAGQSITSSIVASIMQGQADGKLLSTASIESSVSGRTALQQEGWRAPRAHRRAPRDRVPLASPRLIRKQSLQHRAIPADVKGVIDCPEHTLQPRKRQHRRETQAPPPVSLQGEGWQLHGQSAHHIDAPIPPSSDAALDIGTADTMSGNAELAAGGQPSASIPAAAATALAGTDLQSAAPRIPPLAPAVAPATVQPMPAAAATAAAAPVNTGQKDKMKDIMAFLDVVEAQVRSLGPCFAQVPTHTPPVKAFKLMAWT